MYRVKLLLEFTYEVFISKFQLHYNLPVSLLPLLKTSRLSLQRGIQKKMPTFATINP